MIKLPVVTTPTKEPPSRPGTVIVETPALLALILALSKVKIGLWITSAVNVFAAPTIPWTAFTSEREYCLVETRNLLWSSSPLRNTGSPLWNSPLTLKRVCATPVFEVWIYPMAPLCLPSTIDDLVSEASTLRVISFLNSISKSERSHSLMFEFERSYAPDSKAKS